MKRALIGILAFVAVCALAYLLTAGAVLDVVLDLPTLANPK
jgi:hypothetical protein